MMTAVTEMFELYSDTYYQELLLQAASLAGRISTKVWNHILCGIKKAEKVLNLTLNLQKPDVWSDPWTSADKVRLIENYSATILVID